MASLTKDEQIQVLDGLLDDIEQFDDLAPGNNPGNEAFRGAVRQKLLQRGIFLRVKAPAGSGNSEPAAEDLDEPFEVPVTPDE